LNITEVRVKLMRDRSDRLRAFCSVTIDDDFVVHDLRVIEGRKGYFVAMPSRKLTDNCPKCGSKNELRARYCNNCGTQLDETRATEGSNARDKFHVDVAHPINTPCREDLQETVLAAYEAEIERVEQGPGPEREYDAEELEDLTEEYEGIEKTQQEEEAELFEPETEELPEEEEELPAEQAAQLPGAQELSAGEAEEAEEVPAPETVEAEDLWARETEELPDEEPEEAELLEQPAEEPIARAVPPLPAEEPAEEAPEAEKEEEEPAGPETDDFGAGIF